MTHKWKEYTGEYEKEFYDIKLESGNEYLHCWPNAGNFHLPSGGVIDGEAVKFFRLSENQAFCIFNDDDGSLVLIFDNLDDAKYYVDTWNEKNPFVRYYLEVKGIVNGRYRYEPVKNADGVIFMHIMVKDNA